MWNCFSKFLAPFLFAASLCLTGCERLFFYPSDIKYTTPDQLGLKFDEFHIENKNQPTLIGWFLHAEGPAKGTVIQLHGNAENMSSHIQAVKWLPKAGFNVVTVDYRGFGGSNGSPTFHGAVKDVERTFRYVRSLPGVDQTKLALLAQSIGGSLGVYAAAEPEFANIFKVVVVDSAFASYRGVAWEKMTDHWFTTVLAAPFIFGVSSYYNPVRAVERIKTKHLLFIAHEDDPIVPPHNTRDLFDKAPEPKDLWILAGRGHISTFPSDEEKRRFSSYLEERTK